MTMDLQPYLEKGKAWTRKLALDSRFHIAVRGMLYVLTGFCLSAASLSRLYMPLAMAFTFACSGVGALLSGVGGILGYLAFWGRAGVQGAAWVAAAALYAALLGGKRTVRDTRLLLPAVAGLVVAASGVIFQGLGMDNAGVPLYLLRIGLGAGASWLFAMTMQSRNPVLQWISGGLLVLALAQIMPIPYLGLGYIAAGMLGGAGTFPGAALAGLALDLAQVTPVPMTAVLVLTYLVRLLPRYPKWMPRIAPTLVYLAVVGVCRRWDLHPLPGLFLGGMLCFLLPGAVQAPRRRGETGALQVRLEMASGVLAQTEQMLIETPTPPVDEDALVVRAAQRACGGCPCRKTCKDEKRITQLPGLLLHKPLLTPEELPIVCRKSGRFLAELHRSQEQLRSICSDRERQREYRAAVIQQYRFLSEFLQELSDQLPKRLDGPFPVFEPEVFTFGNRPESDNGDRSLSFAGTLCRYYVVLCDGMGTGLGAVREGRSAGTMLRRLLTAGYPAEHALRSLNSLCALRDRAGAVTVDLLEADLSSGKAVLYKWGAAPSYLVNAAGAEKIGVATPPPGISVTDEQESSYKMTLRRSEILVLVSDGVGETDAMRCCRDGNSQSPRELATRLLTLNAIQGEDDATVVTVRLKPIR